MKQHLEINTRKAKSMCFASANGIDQRKVSNYFDTLQSDTDLLDKPTGVRVNNKTERVLVSNGVKCINTLIREWCKYILGCLLQCQKYHFIIHFNFDTVRETKFF